MPEILIVSDAPWVRREVRASLMDPGLTAHELSAGAEVLPRALSHPPDLLVIDQQVGNMGAMAVCLDLRLEESGGRLPHIPVLILLDRRPDVFLARQAGAEGWIIKPLDSLRLGKAVRQLLAGGTYFDQAHLPPTVPSPVVSGHWGE